jgi:hypothetical protein
MRGDRAADRTVAVRLTPDKQIDVPVLLEYGPGKAVFVAPTSAATGVTKDWQPTPAGRGSNLLRP